MSNSTTAKIHKRTAFTVILCAFAIGVMFGWTVILRSNFDSEYLRASVHCPIFVASIRVCVIRYRPAFIDGLPRKQGRGDSWSSIGNVFLNTPDPHPLIASQISSGDQSDIFDFDAVAKSFRLRCASPRINNLSRLVH